MRASALAIAAGVLAFHLALATRTTLWDRDEPRFAYAAVQMARSGQYLYPSFGGEVRAQKPILVYWLMALSIGALGVSELAVRCWSALALTVTALATYIIGRRLLSDRAGLIAMAIVATNPLAAVEGTAATTDAVLMAAITVAVAAFVWRLTSPSRLIPIAIFAGAVACALLAKAPVGLLPVLVAAGTLWSRRRRRSAAALALEVGAAALAGIALFLFWWVPANAATGWRFFTEGVQRDIIGRVLSPQEGHGGNPLLWLPFYPMVIAIGFAPWSAYVPAALRQLRLRERDDVRSLLTWWIAGPLVAFSAAATHLPHYILPMWPPLALVSGATIDSALARRLDDSTRRWLRGGLALAAIAAATATAAILTVTWLISSPSMMWRSLLTVTILISGTAAFIVLQRRARDARAYGTALAGAILFEAALGFVWLPAVDLLKPVPRLAREIRRTVAPGAPVATFDFDEPSLDFYLDTTTDHLSRDADVARWAYTGGSGVLVTTRSAIAALGPLPLAEIGSATGINIANGRHVELVALARRTP